MIKIQDLLSLTFKNFKEDKKKVLLTISGIIIGVFIFSLFTFLTKGMSNFIENQFSGLGFNVVMIMPSENVRNGPPIGEGITKQDLNEVKAIAKNSNYAIRVIYYMGIFEYNRKKDEGLLLALEDWDVAKDDFETKLKEGRRLKNSDKSAIVIGGKVKNKFDKDKEIRVGETIKINNIPFQVVGVNEEKGDLFIDSTITTTYDGMRRVSEQTTSSAIRVSYPELVDMEEEVEKLKIGLNGRKESSSYEEKFTITTPLQQIERVQKIVKTLGAVLSIVSIIILIVANINVLNTMYIKVTEKKNEISTMKAIGAKNSDLIKLFLLESFLYGTFGCAIGYLLSFGFSKSVLFVVEQITKIHLFDLSFDIQAFITTLLITTIVTIIFGTYPAIMAAKNNPADNLKYE